MTVIAVIPARIGSKRIPRKNLKPLCGKPLVSYSVDRVIDSQLIDHTVVSTDSDEILKIVEDYGKDTIEGVKRDPQFARDTSSTEDVLLNIADLKGLKDEDAIVTLHPTSPFRSRGLIDSCIRLYLDNDLDSVLTVAQKKIRMGKLDNAGRFVFLEDYSPYMHQVSFTAIDICSVYVTRVEYLKRMQFVIGERCMAIEVDEIEAHDINTPTDWLFAEFLLNEGKANL